MGGGNPLAGQGQAGVGGYQPGGTGTGDNSISGLMTGFGGLGSGTGLGGSSAAQGTGIGVSPYGPGDGSASFYGAASPANPYEGQNLANQTAHSFTAGLGGMTDQVNAGQAGLGASGIYGSQAGQGFNNAGTVAGSNLSPYLNPYQQNVIDTTMGELDRQHDLSGQRVSNAADAAHAFGGDRFGIQQAANDRDFMTQKAATLSGLNSSNFLNAQQMAQGDVGNRLASAAGLSNLSSSMGGIGSALLGSGASGLANMANMGFGFGDSLQKNQLTAGALQNQQQQQIIDLIKSQFGGFSDQGASAMEALLKSMGAKTGSNTVSTTNNPGLLGTIGGLAAAGGAFIP